MGETKIITKHLETHSTAVPPVHDSVLKPLFGIREHPKVSGQGSMAGDVEGEQEGLRTVSFISLLSCWLHAHICNDSRGCIHVLLLNSQLTASALSNHLASFVPPASCNRFLKFFAQCVRSSHLFQPEAGKSPGGCSPHLEHRRLGISVGQAVPVGWSSGT